MLVASYKKKILNFNFEAGTSRGIMQEHTVYYIFLHASSEPNIVGIGEAAPLKGLSFEYSVDFEKIINEKIIAFNFNQEPRFEHLPSLTFAFETALLDLANKGKKMIFDTPFYHFKQKIYINGLVWMGKKEQMKTQIVDKINAGFTTIKLKIGAIDFEQELELLAFVRKEFYDIEIRVDANGAFLPIEALEKLKKLSDYSIHSIEQPIKQGQWNEMAYLCANSPIPIALDEELIGINNFGIQKNLLNTINPAYLILKPTLLGGFEASKKWIDLANATNLAWWITSALESNIGLNAICQFCSNYTSDIKQGLGTGNLYNNNIESPLTIENGAIYYEKDKKWGILK